MAHLCPVDEARSTLLDYANKCNREKFNSQLALRRDRLADEKLFLRRLHLERKEAELEEAVVRSQEMKVLTAEQCKQEERLARQVATVKHADLVERKTRQWVRENSHEIKAFEEKLRAAYCVKVQQAQIAEKEAEKIKTKEDEKRHFQQLETVRMKEEDFLKHQDMELAKKKYKYKKELQEQIILTHQMRKCLYEEYLREKKMIDEVTARLHDEDIRIMQERMAKKNRTRMEMEQFMEAQKLWRKHEREVLEKEQRRIGEAQARDRDNEKERLAKWKEKQAAKERVKNYIMENMKKEQKRKEDLQDMLEDLAAEQIKQYNEEDEKKEIEQEMRKRLKMRQALDEQRYYKMIRLKREEEEEASYRRQEMERLAEMAKLDQMSDVKRRMKKLEHGRAVEEMIADRRRRRAEEMAELVALHKLEQDNEKRRQRMIEEERLELLKEHAKNLAGYLPPGMIKSEDREILGELLVCNELANNKS